MQSRRSLRTQHGPSHVATGCLPGVRRTSPSGPLGVLRITYLQPGRDATIALIPAVLPFGDDTFQDARTHCRQQLRPAVGTTLLGR
jgi:hypothetical protein